MDNTEFEKLLSKIVFDKLNEEELQQFRSFLEENPGYAYVYERLLDFSKEKKTDTCNIDVEKAWKEHEKKYFGNENVDIETAEPTSYRTKNKWLKRSLSLTLLLVVVLSFVYIGRIYFVGKEDSSVLSMVVYKTGNHENKNVKLPDGTIVRLNANSSVTFDPIHFDKKNRIVQFSGEGLFDVAHNANRPFLVKMEHTTIKVLGTVFNVKNYRNQSKIETSLFKGKIEFSLDQVSDKHFILNPNEKISVELPAKENKDNIAMPTLKLEGIQSMDVNGKTIVSDTSWLQGQLVFKRSSLFDLSKEIANKYGKEIIIKDSVVGNYEYTGTIPDLSLEKTLSALKMIQPFNYKIENQYVIVTKQ